MGSVAQEDVKEALRTARDLSAAACHLANLAARLAGHHELPEHELARQAALEASVRAARQVFSIEDRSPPQDADAALGIAADSLALAEDAVRCAREAVEATLPTTVSH